MLLRRVSLENVRSFLDRRELHLQGGISILIGPNGGGKTNLLDSIVTMLRRHLFASMYAAHAPAGDQQVRYEFRHNDALNQLTLEKHSLGANKPQLLEVELEVTASDIRSMKGILADAQAIAERASHKYVNLKYEAVNKWDIAQFFEGQRIAYRLHEDHSLRHVEDTAASRQFLEFLQIYEIDSQLREEFGISQLSTPMIYLPVNRTAATLSSHVELSGYDPFEQKRQSDASHSRSGFTLVQLAIGRLAQRHRLLLERDTGTAKQEFKSDPNLVQLSKTLSDLGYEWELVGTNPLRNAYDIQLTKQGKSFLIGRASSGERELLTYLFSIYALNVRDALVIVDEPELHLHPKWQAILLQLFSSLAEETGNQFVLATHAPTFVSPTSIQYVSRVYSEGQASNIIRLSNTDLPEAKHLFNIVNSQNNERIFFADTVLLVEGISDRIFVEAYLERGELGRPRGILEVVSVGGKNMIAAYRKLLTACSVRHCVLADLDYVNEIGDQGIKSLFEPDPRAIKHDVVDNPKSRDGAKLVEEIEHAMCTGEWAAAQDLWNYVKTRRARIRSGLKADEAQRLSEFIDARRHEHVFLLRHGDLEKYLPEGVRRKDMDKLIRFVAEPDFIARLPEEPRKDLESILRAVIALE